MVQVTVNITASVEHFGRIFLMFLTFNPSPPSQVNETDSYSKTCSPVGMICKAASDTKRQGNTYIKNRMITGYHENIS